MKSCFFIGHREASEEIFPELAEAVEHHIVDYGVTEFIVGNYGGVDRMAARAVISAKALHPGITLLLLLPYGAAAGYTGDRSALSSIWKQDTSSGFRKARRNRWSSLA